METLYGKLILPGSGEIVGTGWLPPKPDLRDYTKEKKEIKEFSKKLGIGEKKLKLHQVLICGNGVRLLKIRVP